MLLNAVQYSLKLHPVLFPSVDVGCVTSIIPSRERDARTEVVENAVSASPVSRARTRWFSKPTVCFTFSTPPLNPGSGILQALFFLKRDQQRGVSCGSCGKPGVFVGFSKRVLESRSLRSDFKGSVGDLWEGGESSKPAFHQVFHGAGTRGSFHRTPREARFLPTNSAEDPKTLIDRQASIGFRLSKATKSIPTGPFSTVHFQLNKALFVHCPLITVYW
jgi:hypothetical protein